VMDAAQAGVAARSSSAFSDPLAPSPVQSLLEKDVGVSLSHPGSTDDGLNHGFGRASKPPAVLLESAFAPEATLLRGMHSSPANSEYRTTWSASANRDSGSRRPEQVMQCGRALFVELFPDSDSGDDSESEDSISDSGSRDSLRMSSNEEHGDTAVTSDFSSKTAANVRRGAPMSLL